MFDGGVGRIRTIWEHYVSEAAREHSLSHEQVCDMNSANPRGRTRFPVYCPVLGALLLCLRRVGKLTGPRHMAPSRCSGWC
jgi:hypothetical protein